MRAEQSGYARENDRYSLAVCHYPARAHMVMMGKMAPCEAGISRAKLVILLGDQAPVGCLV